MKRCACIDTLYTELPFEERFAAAKADGFESVEFWDWRIRDLDRIKQEVDKTGIVVSGFNGDADFSLVDPTHKEKYLAALRESMEAAKKVGAPTVTIHSNALGEGGVVVNHYTELSDTVKLCSMYDTLLTAVKIAEEYQIRMNLEALNIKVDHVGNFLQTTQMAAAYMAEHIPEGGTVGILAGVAQQDAHRQRVAGFRDYVREHGGLRLVAVTMDAAQYQEAALQTERMIEEHPDLAGLFVTSAIMSLGAVDTLSAHAAHPVLVGVDTQNDALRALRDGRMDAIISQDGNDTGRAAIEAVSDALAGRTIPANSYITNALITAANAQDYLLQEDF